MIKDFFGIPGPHRGLGGPILGFGGPEGSKVLNFHRGLFSPGDALSLTFRAFFDVEIMKTGKFRHDDLVDNFLLKVGTVSSSSAYFCLVCIA